MAFNTPAYDIQTRLQALGLVNPGVDSFVGDMPAAVSNCISLYDTTGRSPVRTSAKTTAAARPSIMIMGRGGDYSATYYLMSQIWAALQSWSGTVNSSTYLDVVGVGAINYMGVDENGLYRFSANFNLTLKLM